MKATIMNQRIKNRRTKKSGQAIENPLAAPHPDEPVVGEGDADFLRPVVHETCFTAYDASMSGPASNLKYVVHPDASPANRFGLDYAQESKSMPELPVSIIDVHTHIGGLEAVRIYKRASECYGIGLTYSMTQLEQVPAIREAMEDKIRFIAVPNWNAADKKHELGYGFIDRLQGFRQLGVRICKFWAAPRSTDYAAEFGDPEFMKINAPHRIEAMQEATDLGMYFMAHIADPDTWFTAKYADHKKYGKKHSQYEPFEEILAQFPQPWICAHMGGWPEDLEFLSGLLSRHDNLYLDTSAAKWIIREISRHSRDDVIDFLTRFDGRILFGSDIVTSDDHLHQLDEQTEMTKKASNTEEAFDLYASRYWALRMLWETDYDGESPIADPDLAMVEPEQYGDLDAPQLTGKSLPENLLRSLYHDAADNLLEELHRD